MKTKVSAGLILAAGLCACQTVPVKEGTAARELLSETHSKTMFEAVPSVAKASKWFNPDAFGQTGELGKTPDDLRFELTLQDADGSALHLTSCMDVAVVKDRVVVQTHFSRWQRLQANCEAANRFFRAPQSALDYWPESLSFELLKTFPATLVPGANTDAPITELGQRTDIQPVAGKTHGLKVLLGQLEVIYVVLAKGDFNQDGYQDWFVRLDWKVANSAVEGVDWIVLTRRNTDQLPFVLWRK